MKTLLVLYTVLLLGFGHCRDDINGDYSAYESIYGNLKGELKGKGSGRRDLTRPMHISSLDLSHSDSERTTIREEYKDGLQYKDYYVKDGVRVTSVVENGMPIWTSFKGERCLYVDTFTGDGGRIMSICTYAGEKMDYLYYEYIGAWKEITEEEFSKRYREMRNSQSPCRAREALLLSNSPDKIPTEAANLPPGCAEEACMLHTFTIDISSSCGMACRSFEYYYEDNRILIIHPNKSYKVTRLVHGRGDIWKAQSDEELGYTKLYLKDDKLGLVFVAAKSSDGLECLYYEEMGNEWKKCPNYSDKIKALKVHVEYATPFSLDISATIDGRECTIFDVESFGVGTRNYFPGRAYLAKEVRDGDQILWKADREDKRCVSSIILFKDGSQYLLRISVMSMQEKFRWSFEKVGGEWKSITCEDFEQKRDAIPGNTCIIAPKEYQGCIVAQTISCIWYGFRALFKFVRGK